MHAGVVHLGGAVDGAVIPVDLRCEWDLHIYQVLVMGGCRECGVLINIIIGLLWLEESVAGTHSNLMPPCISRHVTALYASTRGPGITTKGRIAKASHGERSGPDLNDQCL